MPNEEVMLTTSDNPYNPFTQFDDWYAYDVAIGHNTCSYLSRIAKSSDELSETEEIIAINEAIDEILELNITGLYVKVTQNNFDSVVTNKVIAD